MYHNTYIADVNCPEDGFRWLTWRLSCRKATPMPQDERCRPILRQQLPGYSCTWLFWIEGSPPHGLWWYDPSLTYSYNFRFGRARVVTGRRHEVVERYARSVGVL